MTNNRQLLITKSASEFLYYLKSIHHHYQAAGEVATKFTPYPLLGVDLGTRNIGLSLTVRQQLKDTNDLNLLARSLSNFSQHNQNNLKRTIIKAKPLTTLAMNMQLEPEMMYRDVSLNIEQLCEKFKVKGIVAGYQTNYNSSEELLKVLNNIIISGDFLYSMPILLQDESRSSFESYIHLVDQKTNINHNMGVIDAFKRYKQDIDTMKKEDKMKLNSISAAVILDRAIKEIQKIK